MTLSRRHILTFAACALIPPKAAKPANTSRLKVMVAGGHPGDPECGCGGTIARYTEMGHEAVLLYMNRGEGYCNRPDLTQCGTVRTAEAQAACAVLKARAAFMGQYDGRAVVDNSHYEDFGRLLDSEKPEVLFVHWPLDSHRDHRALSMLVTDAWLRSGKKSGTLFLRSGGRHKHVFAYGVRRHLTRRRKEACSLLLARFAAAGPLVSQANADYPLSWTRERVLAGGGVPTPLGE